MRFAAIAVAVAGLMITAVAPQAQQAKTPQPQLQADQQQKALMGLHQMETAMNASACPGAFHARQQPAGSAMEWVAALEDRNIVRNPSKGLGVHVDFENAISRVKSLELRVSYLPLRLRRMPVAATLTSPETRAAGEQEKTFFLDRVAATRIGGNLLVGPAATITLVRLVSVTYADDTTWNEPASDACVVVPNKFLQVAAR